MHALIHVRILWGRVCEYDLLHTAENSMGFYVFDWQYFFMEKGNDCIPNQIENFSYQS